jgi:beta-barrel assembly-enhancing protease
MMGYGGRRAGGGITFILALLMAGFALFRYYGSTPQTNPVTGEKQRVANIRPEQEIALGLQAAPEMMQQFGGRSQNERAARAVEGVGQRIVQNSKAGQSPYRFEFHLLDDNKTVNAFALPGGQIFVTEALARRLNTEGELAGVLGHEIGHVVGRHGAEHIAKQQLAQGLTGAAVLAAYDPNNPSSQQKAAIALLIGNLINMKFGRDDELESDRLGVRFMAEAGYDPRAMIRVMEVLKAAGAGGRQPEFFSTHPNPENRIARIKQAIQDVFPNGVPEGLKR